MWSDWKHEMIKTVLLSQGAPSRTGDNQVRHHKQCDKNRDSYVRSVGETQLCLGKNQIWEEMFVT